MVSPDYERVEEEELFDFSTALDALKKGDRITRKGWNGKDMYLYYVPANAYPAQTPAAKEEFSDRLVPYAAYIAMRNVQGIVVMWSASNSDLLEADWIILD